MFEFATRTIEENVIKVDYSTFVVEVFFCDDVTTIDCDNITRVRIWINGHQKIDIQRNRFNKVSAACLLSGIEESARYVIKSALSIYAEYYSVI